MSAPEITIIDYGMGNILSVQRGFEHCGAKVILTSNPDQILSAKRVVLPGVGAFGNAMQALESLNLVTVIHELANNQTPLLGICLGMQLLLDESEEFGNTSGLGLIPGRVVQIPTKASTGVTLKIPHIGWSSIRSSNGSDGWNGSILQDNHQGDAAYFVHSFISIPSDRAHRVAECVYGDDLITAVIQRGKITGCQFHPEKSGEVGLKILRRFILQ